MACLAHDVSRCTRCVAAFSEPRGPSPALLELRLHHALDLGVAGEAGHHRAQASVLGKGDDALVAGLDIGQGLLIGVAIAADYHQRLGACLDAAVSSSDLTLTPV